MYDKKVEVYVLFSLHTSIKTTYLYISGWQQEQSRTPHGNRGEKKGTIKRKS